MMVTHKIKIGDACELVRARMHMRACTHRAYPLKTLVLIAVHLAHFERPTSQVCLQFKSQTRRSFYVMKQKKHLYATGKEVCGGGGHGCVVLL